MSRIDRSTLVEVSIMLGLAFIGVFGAATSVFGAVGLGKFMAAAAALAGSVGGNWATSLAQKGYSCWCDTWFTERGALNHDLSWALGEAFKQAVRQLRLEWKESTSYHHLQRKSSTAAEESLAPFDWLTEDAQKLFGNASRLAAAVESADARAFLSQSQPALLLRLQDALGGYLYGQPAAEHVKSRLADEWVSRFREILKDPAERNTRALRAYEGLWQASVDAALADIIQQTTRISQQAGEIKQDTGQILARIDAVEPLLRHLAEHLLDPIPDAPVTAMMPPLPASPPAPDDFIGRQSELQSFRNQLAQRRLAMIAGMAGVGKQALGSRLAADFAESGSVFWMTYRPGVNTDVDATLSALAGYLFHQGEPHLWHILQGELESGGRKPLNVKLEALLSGLGGGRHLLCFQNLHLAGDDPQVDALLAEIRHKAGEAVSLLVISLEIPAFASDLPVAPLTGLTQSDARLLLDHLGAGELPPAVFDELYRATQGNMQLLRLFSRSILSGRIDGSAAAADPARARALVASLAQSADVRAFLLREVYESLTAEERRLAELVSAFRLPVDDQDIGFLSILAMEGFSDTRRLIDSLLGMSVVVRVGQTGWLDFHPVVRHYLSSRLEGQREMARRLHLAIGDYYEAARGDIVEAAYHYQMAEASSRCIEVLYDSGDTLISSGRAAQVLELLRPFKRNRNALLSWAMVAGLRGQAQAFAGEIENALGSFEEALATYEDLDLEPTERRRAADIARRLGRAYGMRGEFDRAHACMRQGLAWLGDPAGRADKEAAALLHTHTGSLYYWEERYREAEQSCQQALALLGSLLERGGHAEAFMVLGVIYDLTGRWNEAVAYARRSLEIWRRLGNTYRSALAGDNLATLCFYRGELGEAEALYRRNLEIWQATGAAIDLATALSNLGGIALIRGETEQARLLFDQALSIFQQSGSLSFTPPVFNNLGMLELALGNSSQAEWCYAQSRDQDESAENLRGLAEAALGQGKTAEALDHARRSFELAEQRSTPFEIAVTLRTLGRVSAAFAHIETARAQLERSVALLRDLGARYELARSLCELGRLEAALPELESARQDHLDEATRLFQEIGAAPDPCLAD